jgi:agmatine deiminase
MDPRRTSRTLDTTPAADGFGMPAEFGPHAGTWMAWPQRPDNWRQDARPAQEAFAAVAAAIAVCEPVTVGASAAHLDAARALLPAGVRVVELETGDAWMRDVGPTFLTGPGGARRGADWIFNAWGGDHDGLYSPWDVDDAAAARILEIEGADRYRAPFVLEGGAIHVDGEGTVLTTEECLLSPGRNPTLSREQIEGLLCEWLGAEKVLWLGAGVLDDETTGHIDNLACFTAPGVVALTWTDDESDPQHAISADAERRLLAMTDARGRSIEVHRIHQPGPLTITGEEAAGVRVAEGTKPRRAGERMAGSYVNFFIATDRVVFPLLDERWDGAAAEKIAELFPGREVVGVPGREILLGGGNVHCITQQVPR